MAIFKKTPQPFVVPSLAEADPDGYGALHNRIADLHRQDSEARATRKAAEAALAADKSIDLHPDVAELLGDGVSAKHIKRTALKVALEKERAIEAALAIGRQRLDALRTAAVRAARDMIRPEYDRRVAALCEALRIVDAAHAELDDLFDEAENNEIPPSVLGERPWFLGRAREPDRKIAMYLKGAGHAA